MTVPSEQLIDALCGRGWVGHRRAEALMAEAGAKPSPIEAIDRFIQAVARGETAGARAMIKDEPGLWTNLPDAERNLLPDWAQQGNHAGVEAALSLGFAKDATG